MSDDQIRSHFRAIRRKITALTQGNQTVLLELNAALEDLQALYEQMQTNLEVAEITAESWLEENQYIASSCQHYYQLFQFAPIAYLVINPAGIIQEANQAAAHLLNTPQDDLAGQPLILYVAERDRLHFRLKLSQLPQQQGPQTWELTLCPQIKPPFTAELSVEIGRDSAGELEELRIVIYNVSRFQRKINQHLQQQILTEIRARQTTAALPREPENRASQSHSPSLAGLQVLLVEDDTDAREFITALFEAQGIQVRTVTSAAAALAELDRSRPDILVSDIRLPDEDGYSLIRRIRAIEAEEGGHLPAAAITAYLEEAQEKSLQAGFEAYLLKLAQPNEWIEMVAQLARYVRGSA